MRLRKDIKGCTVLTQKEAQRYIRHETETNSRRLDRGYCILPVVQGTVYGHSRRRAARDHNVKVSLVHYLSLIHI